MEVLRSMRTGTRVGRCLLGALLVALAGACSSHLDGDGVFAVRGGDPDHPQLRYADGQVSVNDGCAIRLENGLNPRIPPCYVNGRPVGFC